MDWLDPASVLFGYFLYWGVDLALRVLGVDDWIKGWKKRRSENVSR